MLTTSLRTFILILFVAFTVEAIKSPTINFQSLHNANLQKSSNEKVVSLCAKKEASIDTSLIKLNAIELCICGAFATAFGDFCMHPLDTIKVLQQTGGGLNLIDTAKQIIKTHGFVGLYQGVVPYVSADGISGAIKFATFELSKVFVERRTPIKYHPAVQFLCAAGAMLACSVVLVPGEVLKTKLQGGVVSSLLGGVKQILKEEGFGGLFAGYVATLVRDIPYTMLELGLYENIKTIFRQIRSKTDLDQKDELAAAAITGGISSFLTTPLDVIKTKLMMQSAAEGSGFMNMFLSVYKEKGISGLYVGSLARVSWLLPFTTIYLGVYEFTKRALMKRKIDLYVANAQNKNLFNSNTKR